MLIALGGENFLSNSLARSGRDRPIVVLAAPRHQYEDDARDLVGERHWSAPSGWTVSGCGFDRLPGVLVLELYRAQVSKRGVEPASVVDRVDGSGEDRR